MHWLARIGINRHATPGPLGKPTCKLFIIKLHQHRPAIVNRRPGQGGQLSAGTELRGAAESHNSGYLARECAPGNIGKYDFCRVTHADTTDRTLAETCQHGIGFVGDKGH